jgi:hypothetical protein
MEVELYIPGLLVFGVVVGAVIAFFSRRDLLKSLKYTKERLKESDELLATERRKAANDQKEASAKILSLEGQKSRLNATNEELKRIVTEKSAAMPWLAQMVADVFWLRDVREAQYLESKKHPAQTAAEIVRDHAHEKKELRLKKRLAEYRVALYENLFPWLEDIAFADAEDIAEAKQREIDDADDPASAWLSKDEWASLPTTERYQRALDRYKKRRKNNWEIGREFERYIGYCWEVQGYDVEYHGAIKGFEDFGRDLIISGKTGKIALIQCKYWSPHKIIPEAAVFQLLGSTVSFYIERTNHAPPDFSTLLKFVQPYLYTSAGLDPRIHEIAQAMGIKVKDRLVMEDWPMVKCNMPADGKGIYHLPMDQQYDRVKICKPGEEYVANVSEAEKKGFRRAKRWFGSDGGTA